MRKYTFIVALLSLYVGNAIAQDTLYMRSPKSDYLNPYGWFDNDTMIGWGYGGAGKAAYGFLMEDSVTVYGIAAIILTHFDYYWIDMAYDFVDTSMAVVEEDLLLYSRSGNTLTLHNEQLRVNRLYTPVSYYLTFDSVQLYNTYVPNHDDGGRVFPVYERYFKMPVTLDSIYICLPDTRQRIDNGDGSTWKYDRYGLETAIFFQQPVTNYDGIYPYAQDINETGTWYFGKTFARPFYFPILTRGEGEIDTTTIDTVSIASPRVLERYVGLQPNPASGQVRVVSSFGMSSVEVFNTAGIKVMEMPARSYTATLDVSGLDEGTYLVRVVTPSGITTKKLLVTHDR